MQPIDEKVLTVNGWRDIGTLDVGDMVYSSDGLAYPVHARTEPVETEAWLVEFDDGASVLSSPSQQWRIRDYYKRRNSYIAKHGPVSEVRTLRSLVDDFDREPTDSWRWDIPTPAPVKFPHRPVLIMPYLMGALLGDGSLGYASGKGQLSLASKSGEVIPEASIGLPDGYSFTKQGKKWTTWSLGRGSKLGKGRPNILVEEIKSLGLWGSIYFDKFIPELYMINSPDVRLAVIQGLMDTDGCAGEDGSSSFYSVSKDLAYGLAGLVRSMGGKATIRTQQRKPFFNKTTGRLTYPSPNYIVAPRRSEFDMFRLERKLIRSKRYREVQKYRMIRSVKDAGRMDCISMKAGSPDGTYITRDFIVTHGEID